MIFSVEPMHTRGPACLPAAGAPFRENVNPRRLEHRCLGALLAASSSPGTSCLIFTGHLVSFS